MTQRLMLVLARAAVGATIFTLAVSFDAAGQTAQPPHTPPKAANSEKQDSIALAAAAEHQKRVDRETEVQQALTVFENGDVRAKLKKLIDARLEFTVSDKERKRFRRNLPFNLNDYIDGEKTAHLAPIADQVFVLMKAPDREAIVYQAEKPLIMTWKGYYILISSGALDLLTEAEIAAQIAHETAHFFWTDELRRAFEERDDVAARTIELRCDAAAVIALDWLNLPTAAFISGLEKMISVRRTFGIDDHKDNLHPTLAQRQKLARLIIERLQKPPMTKSAS